MLLFSVTGITLNHAAEIEAKPRISARKAQLPAPLLAELRREAAEHTNAGATPLPPALRRWTRDALAVEVGEEHADWSSDEVYLPLPRPGGDAWLRVGLADGETEYELTERGWISWLNDMHKGRHTGDAWRAFIDLFGVACLVFSLSGLLILKFHAAARPTTWPMVAAGLTLPVLLALLFIH